MAEPSPFEESVAGILAATDPSVIAEAAPHFDDPLTDALSVASAANRDRVRSPDPAVERDLSPAAAVAAASGLMIAPVVLHPGWWRSLDAPLLADAPDGPVAVIPDPAGRAVAVTPGSRRSQRVGHRTRLGPTGVKIAAQMPTGKRWWQVVGWSLRGKRRALWQLLGLSVLSGFTALLMPLTTSALFSYAIPWGDLSKALAVLGAFAVASLAAAVLLLARNTTVVGLRDASDARLSGALLATVLRLPSTFLRRSSQGDLLNRTLTVEQARSLVDDSVLMMLLTAVFGLTNLLFLTSLSAAIGVVVTLTVVVLVVSSVVIQVRARAALSEVLAARRTLDETMMECIAAAVPIRVAAAETRAFARWAQRNAVWLRAAGVRMHRQNASQPLTAVSPIIINLVLVTSIVAMSAPLAAREFVPAYSAVVQLTVAMTLLGQSVSRLWELGPVLQQMDPITSAESERVTPGRPPGRLAGRIALTNIVFGYDAEQPPLFDGLSMTVQPGEFVAIVGPSGSGKTTILRLLLGFEQPWSGVVEFDGNDLAHLDVAAVRRQMGTVTQSSVPFGATLRECICGPRVISDEELWAVLAKAGLDEVAREIGLDASIGEGGSALSGGQVQRLMIARALVGQPRILLLDEATSALDNLTQDIVMNAVMGMPATRIAIAHRLSTVENADRVLVVADGRIVEQGPPAVLRASGGHFARLAARQEF